MLSFEWMRVDNICFRKIKRKKNDDGVEMIPGMNREMDSVNCSTSIPWIVDNQFLATLPSGILAASCDPTNMQRCDSCNTELGLRERQEYEHRVTSYNSQPRLTYCDSYKPLHACQLTQISTCSRALVGQCLCISATPSGFDGLPHANRAQPHFATPPHSATFRHAQPRPATPNSSFASIIEASARCTRTVTVAPPQQIK